MQLIHVGYNSMVNAHRVLAILNADSAPIKRQIAEAREAGTLIDATYGRKTRSVLVMDSNHLVLSALQAETVSQRILGRAKGDRILSDEETEVEESDDTEKDLEDRP